MKEEEIRPAKLFDRYLELSIEDGNSLDRDSFVHILCPGCGQKNSSEKFVKNGYIYKNCENCNSLFCSPRPSSEQLDFLYSRSSSSAYWSNTFFPSVMEVRKEKLFKPKAKKISSFIAEKKLNLKKICDIGAGHGLFLEELSFLLDSPKYYAIEPDSTSAKICRNKGFEVLEEVAETASEWNNKFDLVLSSEVIEHVFDPKKFLQSLYNLLIKDGYLLMTGLGYEGFDILTLQENSKSVTPPHHLNFLSIKGFQNLLSDIGFSQVDIWTPGKLDVDIVLNSDFPSPFIEVLRARGSKVVESFQQFLASNQLSSHVWVFAKK